MSTLISKLCSGFISSASHCDQGRSLLPDPGLLLLEQDVFSKLPHSASPAAMLAGKLADPDGVGLGVCRRRAQTRQPQTSGRRCFRAWEEKLRLSGCLITDEGCAALASALTMNPSHLKELDLSFNYPREAGMESLAAIMKNPSFRLESLNMEPGGERWLTPGLRKYSCPPTVDLNTVNRFLKLSNKNRKVTLVENEEQPYPDHPDRFDLNQLLCTDGLTGRSYWEVEWGGKVYVSLSYRGINRKGVNNDSWFGLNDNSWSLVCSDDGYTVWHNGKKAFIPISSYSSSPSGRVAVYVDCPAGTLSFYRVSSHTLIHIYTANTKFTEPLYPGFGFEYKTGSWMSLCSL
ncbi:E3 ubiquitin-protein ligase TRIM21-like [Xiphophorus maculatus]|uniref:E3 ubiquitin-protein ligase TRIM21-like n=1 Tax=Xiphophorus maculatus TaxID=8083 RepID=UPI000C6D6920|nr:E3 ubiquitin-protein ligase TRIM21-like [Xiphophorus maculatus]